MIERRPFGRTGHLSSVTLFGAAALARASQADADRALEVLLRHGVNHIDTAARYGDSELRIGPWMARHRKDFFLATKTGSRTAREARDDIHRSLERLRVDHVDLLQFHSLMHPDDWDTTMGPDRADAHDVVPAAGGPARHRPRRALGDGPARRVPQHGRRSLAAAALPRRRQPLRAPPVRRRDGHDARRRPHDLAVWLAGLRSSARWPSATCGRRRTPGCARARVPASARAASPARTPAAARAREGSGRRRWRGRDRRRG